LGAYSEAQGADGATAIGQGAIAKSYSSIAMGVYNDPISSSNANTFISTDPLFLIGMEAIRSTEVMHSPYLKMEI
jgi:hypothetical protein